MNIIEYPCNIRRPLPSWDTAGWKLLPVDSCDLRSLQQLPACLGLLFLGVPKVTLNSGSGRPCPVESSRTRVFPVVHGASGPCQLAYAEKAVACGLLQPMPPG